MSAQQRYRSMSSSPTEESEGSNKSRKTHHGQSAPSISRPVRRAARACDRCRASKLRCQAPDPSTSEKRCAHCVRTDAECQYSNPPPAHATSQLGGGSRGVVDTSDGDRRLSKLEANVVKLLEMMEKRMSPLQRSESLQHPQAVPPGEQAARAEPTNTTSEPNMHPPDLDQFAASDQIPVTSDAGFDVWLSPTTEMPQRDIGSNNFGNLFDSLVSVATDHAEASFPPPQATLTRPRVPSTTTALTASPNTSDTRKTPASLHDAHTPSTGAAKARPIPRADVGSRMAAFTEPSSHEAPFRPLAYNPDTFRNAEMADRGHNNIDGASDDGGAQSTPKRGRGDPIDRGIFTEDEARLLFDFFQEHIAFFMPIFQEPMTFDHIRHQSSFLLSTILAVATKYTCVVTGTQASLFGASSPFDLSSSGASRLKPISEDKWYEIRGLAITSYFQALISKVHCLEDVQAILLQCAWGLQDRGASPDPWMMTGSAYRLARRLGIHLAAEALASGSAQPNARIIASLKTYLCLYAFDRFFTVGFGRPETEGFEKPTLDTSILLSLLQPGNSSTLGLLCSSESAACVAAYVELANIAKQYSRFVNVTLKAVPSSFLSEMGDISSRLDAFSSRWLWARSPLSAKLGCSQRPIKMLYNHIRLCLHSVPLKPVSHPDSELFLQRTRLQSLEGSDILSKCLKKAQDCAVGIIQDFADDSREDNDTILSYGFDYAFMVLAHAAAILLSMATISVCGIGTASPTTYLPETPSSSSRAAAGQMDRAMAKRYYEMAITAMVDSNRSANFFPCDMACNLGLIAQEMGISVAEWMSNGQGCRVGRQDQCACSHRSSDHDPAIDFGSLLDIDQFLQPGFLEDGSLFSSTMLM